MKLINGDIHEVIKTIESNSIDCIYTNPPFGTTKSSWDKGLDWSKLWVDIWRVVKPKGVIILHCAMPFTYELIRHSPVNPKYHYVWVKNNSTLFYLAKKQPLRKHEEILVYYKNQPTYNPQMTGNEKIKFHLPDFKDGSKNDTQYYGKRNHHHKDEYHIGKYPTTILEYPIKVRGDKTISNEMVEFFIKTYTNENDVVLDMTCCSDVVGNIVSNLNREYIGVDNRSIKRTQPPAE